jgi:CRP-like cAMP-binding protein
MKVLDNVAKMGAISKTTNNQLFYFYKSELSIMTDNTVYSALQQVTGFSGDEMSVLLNRFEEKNIRKKTTILSCGKVAKEIYFIISGCMRLYYDRDGMDISAFFFTENMFAGAYDSFTTKTKSRHFIETMEDCHCLSINYNHLQSLYLELPKMNELIRKVLEKRFFELHQLFTSQILDSPEERYLHLLKEYPDLLQRIPQHHIATFLGVTPVSLSRIRSRVSKRP